MGTSYQNKKKTVNLNGLKLAYEMVWITKNEICLQHGHFQEPAYCV